MKNRLLMAAIAVFVGLLAVSCEKEFVEAADVPEVELTTDGILKLLKSGVLLEDIKELKPDIEESTLKGTEDDIGYLNYDQLDYQGSATLGHPSYYNMTRRHPFMLCMSWQDTDPQFGQNWIGTTGSRDDYYGTNSTRFENNWWWHQQTLIRFQPDLDPVGYNGHIGLLIKGEYPGQEVRFRVVIATDGEGDSEILPEGPDWFGDPRYEQNNSMWHFYQEEVVINHQSVDIPQPGVYMSGTFEGFDLTGDWQFIEMDAESMWWSARAQAPAGDIDDIEPLIDDAFLLMQVIDFGEKRIEFIVNGQVPNSTPKKGAILDGPNDVIQGETYTFSFDEDMEYHDYQWSVSAGKGQIVSGQGTDEAQIKITALGNISVSCKSKFHQMAWSVPKARLVVSEQPGPPQPPGPPVITGPSPVSLYATEGYTMPSGKQDYEWRLPYGCTSVQEFNNINVIQFNSSGAKTIEGRYFEGTQWSSWGYKSVYVY